MQASSTAPHALETSSLTGSHRYSWTPPTQSISFRIQHPGSSFTPRSVWMERFSRGSLTTPQRPAQIWFAHPMGVLVSWVGSPSILMPPLPRTRWENFPIALCRYPHRKLHYPPYRRAKLNHLPKAIQLLPLKQRHPRIDIASTPSDQKGFSCGKILASLSLPLFQGQ